MLVIEEKFILRRDDRRRNSKKNANELCIRMIADNRENEQEKNYRQTNDSHRNCVLLDAINNSLSSCLNDYREISYGLRYLLLMSCSDHVPSIHAV